MKTIKYFFAAVGFSLCFLSCSSDKEETLPWFNFGEAAYDEPFAGLLESRPWILVKSLQYPPFSWVAPDTVTFRKNLDITFNNECIRSKSEALVQFKDSLYMPVRGVTVSMNGKPCPDGDFTVSADSISKKVSLQLVISPAAGDTVFNGFVLIRGKELDKANGVDLQQENNVVASWTAKQEIGWPILLWLFWLIATLLAIVLAGYVLYGIYKLLLVMVGKAKAERGRKRRKTYKAQKEKEEEKEEKKEEWRKEIKRRTNWSDTIINALRTKKEAEIYIKAGLKQGVVGGRIGLINPHIDWSAYNCRQEWLKKKLADWDKWKDYNNADLIGEGYPPRDENGDPYELHHIGQKQDSPFAELSWNDHMGDGNNKILHPKRESEIDRQLFDKEKALYWMNRFKLFTKEELSQIYK